ncbi:MAG: hypothetical protein AUK48_07075 [Oscillatoriales cyanobacterium CG2_30_44_21]|nr:MAG: hypothetical protein AUK48_07075 [Oscillatoriales cyanobacterium CG2_30_44_21]
MTREEVRSLLGKPSATFYKTPFSQNSTDAFDAVGVHVHYHSADYCESLEFFEPAKLLLGKTHIFDLSFTEVREWLESDDSELEIDDEGLTCFKYGVGIYAPDWQEDPNLLIEGVIVFNDRDYYNS